jgi:hypothetical protein
MQAKSLVFGVSNYGFSVHKCQLWIVPQVHAQRQLREKEKYSDSVPARKLHGTARPSLPQIMRRDNERAPSAANHHPRQISGLMGPENR